MIMISNKQRDDIVRYLTEFTEGMQSVKSTRVYNTRRLARKLVQVLSAKKPVPLSELPEQLKERR